MFKISLRYFLLSSILLVFFSLSSCKEKPESIVITKEAEPEFQEDLLSDALRIRLNDTLYNGPYCNSFFRYNDTLAYFYAANNYQAQWSSVIENKELFHKIASLLRSSYLHGLDTSWYNLSLLNILSDSISQMFLNSDTFDYDLMAEMEYILSDALLGYSTHLQKGAFDPRLIFPEDYLLPMHELDSTAYFGIFNATDLAEYFRGLPPDDERYSDLQIALAQYREFEAAGGWEEIPFDYERRKKINPGDTTYILSLVAARLKATGMLDTAYFPNDSTQVYDTTLSRAVKQFQNIFGILPDGVIGKRTIREMNTSAEARVRLLEVTLERYRWIRYPKEGKYVRVNLPDFRFFAFKDGIPVDTMKICCGKPKPANYDERLARYLETGKNRPQNMETPCMHSKYSYVVLNPRWHIPRSIAENEIFWSVLKDTAYLDNENIRVYHNGELLDPDTIEWSKYKGRKLPFMFKQDPGTSNSLGIIKFLFWNKFSIFQHDTPAKSAFRWSNRAVSHGCMRLEQPLELAAFLLEDEERWPMDKVRINLGLAPEEKEDTTMARLYREILEERELLQEENQALSSTRIRLKKKIELFVDYYTAWVDGNGVLQFRPDVYRKDKIMSDWFDKYQYGVWPQSGKAIRQAEKGV